MLMHSHSDVPLTQGSKTSATDTAELTSGLEGAELPTPSEMANAAATPVPSAPVAPGLPGDLPESGTRAVPVRSQALRQLGYGIGSPKEVREVADYTNVIWLSAMGEQPDEVVAAARAAGLGVVLAFECDSGSDTLKQLVISITQRNQDVVEAVCWEGVYRSGHQPADLAHFGQVLKETAPGVQLWCNLSSKKETMHLPIPAEVDALMFEMGYVTTPEAVKAKAQAALPARIERAGKRPVFLIWCTVITGSRRGWYRNANRDWFARWGRLRTSMT